MATYKPDSVVFYIRPEEPYDSGFESPPVNCKPAWPVPVRLVESDSKTTKGKLADWAWFLASLGLANATEPTMHFY